MKYTQNQLVRVAKRENNNKRGYLVVNPMQGKHLPTSPAKALELFESLAYEVKDLYRNDRILVVGFAETATAIGAQVAITLNAQYIQTTRENIPDVEYIFFSEAHSHATEQKLVKDDMDSVIENIDRIIFVEDEVTTGNTIMNIVSILKKMYSKEIKFSVCSILNGMNDDSVKVFEANNITAHYLVKTNHDEFDDIANSYENAGEYHKADCSLKAYDMLVVNDKVNPRRLVDSKGYHQGCNDMADQVIGYMTFKKDDKVLVMGTEECMYPALLVGNRLEEEGCIVKSHSTTRSPIEVCVDDGYPLQSRYELSSVYDDARKTFLYNIEEYSKVLVVTDASVTDGQGIYSLVNALTTKNENVVVVRWTE